MRGKNNWQRKDSIHKKIRNFVLKGGLSPWYWNYRYKWNYYPKLRKVDDFPTEVIVETSSVCDLKCIMCFRNHLPNNLKYSFMSLELFKKIIDECRENKLVAIKLSWRGEVLLNKNFPEMVEYAKRADIKEVSVLTNATHLDRSTSQKIIDAGLDQIVFSVDSINKDTYEKIRIGAKFEDVIQNITNFLSLKNKREKPFTRVQITEICQNSGEIPEFLNEWKHVVDEIAVSGFIDYANIGSDGECVAQPELVNAKGRLACPSLWQRLAITADGEITVCCGDVMGKMSLGNANSKTISELWNGDMINTIRHIHIQKKLNDIPVCKRCNARVTYEF